MDEAQNQLVDKLKTANSVLVTVSRDPSVDQLAALLGLTLMLNKQGKHAAAVFSGEVPSTIEFLQPEETFEKNTDSLRDFIIALDKNKADKLRYKVEDDVVRIFITPYRTSITQDDLDFSQGDFNIDLVIAIGVHQQEDLDDAITAHGRILHDAAVASINTTADGGLGTINWHDPGASSLSELVTRLAQALGPDMLDDQIATALLTGIVAETDRFSNEKTSAQTMNASAALMGAGANQQLVVSKLEESPEEKPEPDEEPTQPEDGSLEIDHQSEENEEDKPAIELPSPSLDEAEDQPAEAEKPAETETQEELEPETESNVSHGAKLVTEPPTLGGVLTANSGQEALDPVTDPLSLPTSEPPLLDHQPLGGEEPAEPQFTPPPPAWSPPPQTPAPEPSEPSTADNNQLSDAPADEAEKDIDTTQTLAKIEEAVESPHLEKDLGDARDEVNKALNNVEATASAAPEPIQALNAMPLELNPSDLPSDPGPAPQSDNAQPAQVIDPNAPPPVPPPIPFQFGNPQQPQ